MVETMSEDSPETSHASAKNETCTVNLNTASPNSAATAPPIDEATKIQLVLDPGQLAHTNKQQWNIHPDHHTDDQARNNCFGIITILVGLIMYMLVPSLILIDEKTTYMKLVVGANFLVIAAISYSVFVFLGAQWLLLIYLLFYVVVFVFMYERIRSDDDEVTEQVAVRAGGI
ncbi:Hypothetical predicted protein [Cloeon dipterum]|uniref:Uncharacterized protein n=1 Tax=Cloeon dipterum TaxID=197152 RepID=A0A8S1DU88_9INSE|nr:Hypothetical predicted protein [Cloeon dipterum]